MLYELVASDAELGGMIDLSDQSGAMEMKW